MIKYSSEKSPIWPELVKAMPQLSALWEENLIITYGDTYYSKIETTPDLIVHEEVHVRQQAEFPGGPASFWKKFIEEAPFRLMMELEAYKAQLEWFKKDFEKYSRNERRVRLRQMEEWVARTLSGEIYGNMITYKRALEMIS